MQCERILQLAGHRLTVGRAHTASHWSRQREGTVTHEGETGLEWTELVFDRTLSTRIGHSNNTNCIHFQSVNQFYTLYHNPTSDTQNVYFMFYIADTDEGMTNDNHQDILTCGACQKPFALGDIVRFIQHKITTCNKENNCYPHATDRNDNDANEGAYPLAAINSRRPSISAPISGKKASSSGTRVHTPPPASPRLPAPGDLCVDGAASSTPKHRASSSPLTSSIEDEHDIKPSIKQERMDTSSSGQEESSCKKSRTEVADAESNTTHSGKSPFFVGQYLRC